ncbi:MAG TPA: penicillin-binding protein 2 [Stellaceae bacterium]|jgi:cell division protein FtsI (penicillin-binding protein 3)|nr:penicillin-binding protein 2 [Stellaceae bacterium]
MLSIQRTDENPCRPRHFKPPPCAPIVTDPESHTRIETCRTRMLVAAALFLAIFAVVGLRLADIVLISGAGAAAEPRLTRPKPVLPPPERSDIVDRNNMLLATTLDSPALYADPRQIIDPQEATRALLTVLPNLDAIRVYADLTSDKKFVYLKQRLTPQEHYDVNRLGIPGFMFESGWRRYYPFGSLAAHVVGYTDSDNKGRSGVERGLDKRLNEHTGPLRLSLDARVQFVLRDELVRVVQDFDAKGAAGIIMDVHTGEVVAMVSLPDFDPNHPGAANESLPPGAINDRIFNKVTLGDFELGSVFKIFNTAMALDSGVSTMTSQYDARDNIRIGRFTISDYHGKHRWLSVPEIFMYSSNIGSARMAVAAGSERQQSFLGRLGILQKANLQLDEIATPHYPKGKAWSEVSTMTIAYGHGIAVSPLECVTGVAAIVNGGIWHPATLLKVPDGVEPPGQRVIAEKTSDQMRKLMRLVVEFGTARFAAAPGYVVGGKTGTAEKNAHGRYEEKKLVSTFIGAFPMQAPRYVILALVDEPKGNKETHGYATAGWTVAPATSRIVSRIAPLLGITPVDESSPDIKQALQVESLAGKRIEDY